MEEAKLSLHTLANTSRGRKRRKLLGRGPGSGHGKTCCRGAKGAGARSGYQRRYGYEGGGVPLHRRIPTRGFSRGRHLKRPLTLHFEHINGVYQDCEVVSEQTLREKGLVKGKVHGIKILNRGTLSKKVSFDLNNFSARAKEVVSK